MRIEELFGTLQQSVVSGWRKHLRTHKYSEHMALDEFYKEMPEKVDALIEAWMGANSKKVNSFDNIIVSKNMGTLAYLKELKRVCKEGRSLMNGEPDLESLLDDIVELINSTLYKVKELNENRMMDLKDFIMESIINEDEKLDQGFWHGSDAWVLDTDATGVTILVGGYSKKEALKVQKLVQKDKDLGEYSDDVVYVETDEWEEEQE